MFFFNAQPNVFLSLSKKNIIYYTALMPISAVLTGIQAQVNGPSCAALPVMGVSADGQDKTTRNGRSTRKRGGGRPRC